MANPKQNGQGKFSRQYIRRLEREGKKFTSKELDDYMNTTVILAEDGKRILGPYLKDLADTLPKIKVEGSDIDHYRRLSLEWIRNINKKDENDFKMPINAITRYCAQVLNTYEKHGKEKGGARSIRN